MLRNRMSSSLDRYSSAAALGFLALVITVPLWPTLTLGSEMIWGPDALSHLVTETTNRRALSTGQLPLWNPYNYGGMPGLADVQNQTLYPPLLVLRGLPIEQFFSWGIFLHLWIAGAGVFLFCRQIGIVRAAATAAAVGFALCGSLPYRIEPGHFSLLHTASWIPLALALTVRSVNRCGRLPHPGLVAVMSLQFLSGNPQITFYTGVCIAAYYLFAAATRPRSDTQALASTLCIQFVALTSLALGIAAFQLLPMVRFARHVGRLTGMSYESAAGGSISWVDLANILSPHPDPGPGSALFVGMGLLVFVPLAPWSKQHRRLSLFLLLLSGGALLLALGDALPLYRLHHMLLPSFRRPPRFLFFWSLAITMLGAIGFDGVLRLRASMSRRTEKMLPWVPLLVMAVAALAVALFVPPGGDPIARAGTFLGTPLWLAGLGAAVLAAVGLLAYGPARSMLGPLVVGLLACEGVVFTGTVVTQNSPQNVGLEREFGGYEPGRVVTFCERAVSATDLLLAGIPSTDGTGPLNLAAYARFLALVENSPFTQTTRLDTFPSRVDLFNLLHATHILTCEPIDDAGFQLVGRLGETWTYQNLAAMPRAWLTCPAEPLPAGAVITRLVEQMYDPMGYLVPRPPPVHVTWVESLSDDERRAKEDHYGLARGRHIEGSRWIYDLMNQAPDNVFALLADDVVSDTRRISPDGHIDRRTEPGMDSDPRFAGLPDSILVGEDRCDVRGRVVVEEADQPDGVMRLLTETPTGGLVYLSEPYYPEREAWLDGVPVRVERANLAFSAVAVPPGRHVIQLRYVPRALYWGTILTVLTACAWGLMTWRQRPANSRNSGDLATTQHQHPEGKHRTTHPAGPQPEPK